MYPTIAEILALPALADGGPVVRSGRVHLGTEVRWVHVSEQRQPAGTLSGGELVLSIGAAAADPATEHREYLTSLRDAGAVGLVIELGQHLAELPSSLVQAARALRFPLVELRSSVRFVHVTEVVHARILDEQSTRMRFTQRVTETFRALMVDAAEVDTVLREAAGLLDLPVVLEDLGHRALAFAGETPESLLRDWVTRSRQAAVVKPDAPTGPEGWFGASVGPRAERWGRLVTPRRGPDAEAIGLVLVQAADAITVLARSAGAAPDIALQVHGGLLTEILHGSTSRKNSLRTRARALGFSGNGPFAAYVIATPASEEATFETLRTLNQRLGKPALTGRLREGRIGVLVSGDAEPAILRALGTDRALAVATANFVTAFDDLAEALSAALHTADVAARLPDQSATRVWHPRDLGARGLVWRLRKDRHLLAFVDDQLGPVLRLDEEKRVRALATLRAFVAADGAMTEFARRIGTSRPSAYARVRWLSDVLQRDLDRPHDRLSAYLALLALDQLDP
ncbi:PucR family transcriptional regulator [Amycolatopsis sp. NPDC098790]|uniref:PucR family transcriptional regulator n=1 Tax=Amycolatopsis sp. NPDC098790 TaxID=3363939 RepID=UPI0037FD0A6E